MVGDNTSCPIMLESLPFSKEVICGLEAFLLALLLDFHCRYALVLAYAEPAYRHQDCRPTC